MGLQADTMNRHSTVMRSFDDHAHVAERLQRRQGIFALEQEASIADQIDRIAVRPGRRHHRIEHRNRGRRQIRQTRAGPTERYTILVVAFFFALGWAGARAATTRQRAVVSGLALVLGSLVVCGSARGEPARARPG